MVEAVELLLELRSQCGVSETNKFLFPNQKEGHLDQYQTIKAVCVRAGVKHPEYITSNLLRKYITTILGVSNSILILYLWRSMCCANKKVNAHKLGDTIVITVM